jgi:hypothetical protein
MRRYTPEEEQLIRELYPNTATKDIAKRLGRQLSSIYQAAYKLGLAKSSEFLASDLSGRIQRGKQNPATQATQFKRGHTTWNAGKKGVTGNHPNSRATQFKPGRPPEESLNYRPIGSLRVCRDGYVEIKLNDTDPCTTRRWAALHRVVWERERGPVPEGCVITFKEGQFTTDPDRITTDILECITRGELAKRNHWQRLPQEVVDLIVVKRSITRKVNQIVNQESQTA